VTVAYDATRESLTSIRLVELQAAGGCMNFPSARHDNGFVRPARVISDDQIRRQCGTTTLWAFDRDAKPTNQKTVRLTARRADHDMALG